MNKLLIATPLLVIASFAGATYYSGAQTQNAYDHFLAELNEYKPFTLVNESYQSGMLQSTAVTQVKISTAEDADILFRLQHEINHSPLSMGDGTVRIAGATIRTTLVQDGNESEKLSNILSLFDDPDPVVIDTIVDVNGSMSNRFQLSSITNNDTAASYRFDGLDYSTTIIDNAIIGSGTIGDFVVTAEDKAAELALTGGKINTDLTRMGTGLYTGNYRMGFEKLNIAGDRLPFAMSFEQIALISDTEIEQGKLSSAGGFSVGKIDSPLPLDSAAINMSVDNVVTAGLEAVMEKINQLSVTELITSNDPEAAMRFANQYADLLVAYKSLVGPGTSISYEVSAANAGGEAIAGYSIGVLDEDSPYYPDGGLDSVQTLRDVINILKTNVYLQADAEAVAMTPAELFMMMPTTQQYIQFDGVSYTSDISLENVIVDINGNSQPLEMMLGDMGEMLDMPLSMLISM